MRQPAREPTVDQAALDAQPRWSPPGTPPPAPVAAPRAPLPAFRPRRRSAAPWLAVAAAVVVGGGGLGALGSSSVSITRGSGGALIVPRGRAISSADFRAVALGTEQAELEARFGYGIPAPTATRLCLEYRDRSAPGRFRFCFTDGRVSSKSRR